MNHEEFSERALDYHLGLLDEAERADFDAYLVAHPKARLELELIQDLATQVDQQETGREDAIWQTLQEQIRSAPVDVKTSTKSASSFWQRLNDMLAGLHISPSLTASIMLAQFVVIGALMHESENSPDYAEIRSAAPVAERTGPFLLVQFRDTATEGEIRAQLVGLNARIVNGPDQLGEYYLAVPGEVEAIEKAQQAMLAGKVRESSGQPVTLVVSAQIVNKLPPDDR